MTPRLRIARAAALLLLTGLSIVAARHMLHCVIHPYPLEYGEGVTLLWAQRAAAGQPLYPPLSPDQPPQLHNPYPPAGPLLIATLARAGIWTHPFMAGRLLSLLGLTMAAGAIYSLIRRRASPVAATCGMLTFLLSPVIFRFGPMMRIDALALGIALQSVNLMDRGQTLKRLVPAAVLAMLAILCKPTYAAAGICLALSACAHRRYRTVAPAVLAGALLPLAIVAAWLWLREAPVLGLHLATLQRLPLHPAATFGWLSFFAGAHAPMLAAAAVQLPGRFRTARSRRGTLSRYALLTLLAPLCTALVTGSAEHYLLEVWAVLCVAGALTWDDLRRRVPAGAWALLIMQLALFVPFPPAPVFTRTYGQEIPAGARASWTPGAADAEIGHLLQRELESSNGPVLGSDLGFLLLSQHQPLYQPYQFGHLARAGRWRQDWLAEAIQTGTFPVIVLKGNAEDGADPFFDPGLQKLIHETFELHRVLGPWHLYRRW